MTNVEIKETDYRVNKINVPFTEKNDTTALNILAIGCSHLDSLYSAKNLLKRHLDYALEQNALILFLGDNNDLMQGKSDKRHLKRHLDPQFMQSYFDDVVDYTVDFMKPYANNIAVWGLGNHELKAHKYNETDVPGRIVQRLNDETGSNIQLGGYRGWIKLNFQGSGGFKRSKRIFYSHSGGSMGTRSKGALAIDLLMAQYPGADVYLVAHVHENLLHFPSIEGITEAGKRYTQDKLYAQMPSYKKEWEDKTQSNWWIETNKGTRVVGGWFLDFTYRRVNKQRIIEQNAKILKN